jgi:S1-C subfamily serine protease
MILWAVVAAVSVSAAWADGLADQGRQVLGKNQNAVVAIRVVLKVGMSMGGQTAPKRDQKIETTGVVIDPSGLIVASYATVDPTESLKSVYGAAMTQRGGRAEDMVIETEITDLKIVLGDQSEIAGQVVLRDADLDLAFIRPTEKPAKPLAAVDLAQNAKLQILDEVVVINRLGKVGNRVPAVSIGRIEAVLNKPRTFYVLGQTTWGYSLGAPVFALDGKVAGLILLRNTKADLDTTRGFLFDNLSKFGMMPVILPAEDIQEAAKNAPATAAAPTPKPAE